MPIDTPLNMIGQTALMYFCLNKNLDSIREVLEWGAQLSAVDVIGRTPLHYLVQVDSTGEASKWLFAFEQLKDMYDVNAMTEAGVTPLMLACKLNYEKCVE